MSLDAVLAPLHDYARGHATGDATYFRRAFLPTAHVEGLRDGAFASWDLDTYCGLFDGIPADDEPDRSRTVDAVHVIGSVATATMTLRHGDATFTDMFVLVQVDSTWRIANKVYHRHSLEGDVQAQASPAMRKLSPSPSSLSSTVSSKPPPSSRV